MVTPVGISVGVDIGGTKILAGIVNEQGEILAKVRKKTPRADASGVLEVVSQVITETISQVDDEIKAIAHKQAHGIDFAGRTAAPKKDMTQEQLSNLFKELVPRRK